MAEAAKTLQAGVKYLTVVTLAANWELSAWTIRDYAKRGRISGARKPGRDWKFPEDAVLLDEPAETAGVRAGRAAPTPTAVQAARSTIAQQLAEARARRR